MNQLFCGDNLEILQQYFPDECVDLIYLDPPFKSNQNYNLLFEQKEDTRAKSQKLAFEDTWEWTKEAHEFVEEAINTPGKLADAFVAFRALLGPSDMLAYLAMMAPRLRELHRVLKRSGSLFLHCDPTASHYLKVLADAIFNGGNFRNEIVWKRSDAHNDSKQGAKHYGRVHDTLLFYTKSDDPYFRTLYRPLPQSTVDKWYRHVEEGTGRRYNKADVTGPGGAAKGNAFYDWKGNKRYWRYKREKMEALEAIGKLVYTKSGMVYEKRYLDESKGVPIQDWWDDISMLRGISGKKERVGYPTQKPRVLLERIIEAASEPGAIVLDAFCGCGTAIEAAQKLQRQWIGIDCSDLAIKVVRERLKKNFPQGIEREYELIYEPRDLATAETLAVEDPFQFQQWAVRKLGGGEVRRGADKGVDGRLYFADDPTHKLKHILVSVKAGKRITPAFVRELRGTLEREKGAMGILIAATEPTKSMKQEAVAAGTYRSLLGNFPKIQIITAAQLLDGAGYSIPPLMKIPLTKKNMASVALRQMNLPGISEGS
ncbi:MAG TPA: DNA methyltransferase [Candidatus Angelobacter sp.]|nr:DNA methyltransferase [Candidatus Angelobacter sp.]